MLTAVVLGYSDDFAGLRRVAPARRPKEVGLRVPSIWNFKCTADDFSGYDKTVNPKTMALFSIQQGEACRQRAAPWPHIAGLRLR